MKKTPTPTNGESKIFAFVFQNLAWFLMLINGFLSYSIYNLFTSHVAQHAVFVAQADRLSFSTNLVFGLMACENLLAMATGYFRKRNEWGKSVLVTLVSGSICYFNYLAILEIFSKIPPNEVSEAVKLKVILVNFLIWCLGEIVSLLMNSMSQDIIEQPPSWFVNWFAQRYDASPTSTSHNGLYDNTGSPITGKTVFAQHTPIGFQLKGNKTGKNGRPPLTPEKIAEIQVYLQNGFSMRKTAEACGVSLSTVTEVKKQAQTS